MFEAIAPIEAQTLLGLLEVASFPNMKKEGQSKTLNKLKKIAYSFKRTSLKQITTKEFFEQLRSK